MITSLFSKSFWVTLFLLFFAFWLTAGQCPPQKTFQPNIPFSKAIMQIEKKMGVPPHNFDAKTETLPIEPYAKKAILTWLFISLIAIGVGLIVTASFPVSALFLLGLLDFFVRCSAFGSAQKSLKNFKQNPGKYSGKGYAIIVLGLFPFTLALFLIGTLVFLSIPLQIAVIIAIMAFLITLVSVIAGANKKEKSS